MPVQFFGVGTILQVGLDGGEELGPECLSDVAVTGTVVGRDHRIGGVVVAECSQQELAAEHGQLAVHGQQPRLPMQVILGRHEDRPRGDAESRDLDSLEGADGGYVGIGVPNRAA